MGRRLFFFLFFKGKKQYDLDQRWLCKEIERGTFASKTKKCLEIYLSMGELRVNQTLVSKALLEKNLVGRGTVCQRWQRILVAMLLWMSWTLSKQTFSHEVEWSRFIPIAQCQIVPRAYPLSLQLGHWQPRPLMDFPVFVPQSQERFSNTYFRRTEPISPNCLLPHWETVIWKMFVLKRKILLQDRKLMTGLMFSSCSVLLMLLSVTWLSTVAVIADMQIQAWDEEVVRWLFHVMLIKVLTNATCIRADSKRLRPGLLGTGSRRCDLLERDKLSEN